jgi:hypothetical protein
MTKKTELFDSPEGVPWASKPLEWYLNEQQHIIDLVELSVNGIAMVINIPKILDVLEKTDSDKYTTAKSQLIRIELEEKAELARNEVDSGFPLLHAQAVISIWSGLESTVRNLVAVWFQNRPEVYKTEAMKRIRVRVGEYESLSSDEKAFYVVELLEQELGATLKNGVGRFESLLEPIGMNGPVSAPIKRTIYELSQVRLRRSREVTRLCFPEVAH